MTRVLIVQYAGDYRESDRLLREEGKEIYYGHGYVLEQLDAMRAAGHDVGFMCCLAPAYWDRLANGVTVIGADTNPDKDPKPVLRLIERYAPTHLIVQGPMPALIRWGLANKVALGVILADSFANPFYRLLRFRKLPALLGDPRITLVANHGANAARALVTLGVSAERVIAWDYPHLRTPDLFAPKQGPSGPPFRLFYAGAISTKKGVGDLVRAVALLRDRLDVELDIAGMGQRTRYERLVERLGLGQKVRFLGLVPNGEIPNLMNAADAVVVPSRHSFPEGLPLTLYEALASRTPVIASDHPMFAGHLVNGDSAVVYPAGRPRDLAEAIVELMTLPGLYELISAGGPAAWQRMQIPVKWGEMVRRWISGTPGDAAWLRAHTVAAGDRT
ncbi:MAG: glycosyltransferase family 4 protein [Sphingomonas sp.]|nr:glycosyltransferase family 4 protein [Sphingomonas sp.]MBY0582609.1 glycosyltransferase family 4 protein [Sphingomonas sp.]